MKPIKEIVTKLENELEKNLGKIKSSDKSLVYYNELLGGTSYLLAGLLESLLKEKWEWEFDKWIDDSLISVVVMGDNDITIEGVMIWGRENMTEQWVDPFSFNTEFLNDKLNFINSTFKFADLEGHEISYEKFNIDRNYWDSKERNWKYIVTL